jgi:Protein of unknown function (DUF3891)
MVIGRRESDRRTESSSVWAQIEAVQRDVQLPCLLIPQPAHAVLAGEIAAMLTAFGDLPPEIVRAIQMHDTGWAGSDAQQIQRLRADGGGKAAPVPFVAVSSAELMEAWTASIDMVETLTKAGALVISRHFLHLAGQDKAKQKFVQHEKSRQQRLAQHAKPGDLERWTAALQFCDVLSLYLVSGLAGPAEFSSAPHVSMHKQGSKLHFTPKTMRTGTLTIQGLVHPVAKQGPRAETLTWEVENV